MSIESGMPSNPLILCHPLLPPSIFPSIRVFSSDSVLCIRWPSIGVSASSSVLSIYWKYWCWSWNFNTLATWCEELTHWKRPWCWERLKAGGEGDDRGWDGCMASLTQWTLNWVNSGNWWWTGTPGMLQSIGSQRVGHDWETALNWTELNLHTYLAQDKEKMRRRFDGKRRCCESTIRWNIRSAATRVSSHNPWLLTHVLGGYQPPKHKICGCFITTTFQMSHKFLLWPNLRQNNTGSTFWKRYFQSVKVAQNCYNILYVNLASICTLSTAFEERRAKLCFLVTPLLFRN